MLDSIVQDPAQRRGDRLIDLLRTEVAQSLKNSACSDAPGEADGVSLNQFIAVAVAEKVGSIETAEDFPRRRVGEATPRNLLKFVRQAGDEEPDESDRR